MAHPGLSGPGVEGLALAGGVADLAGWTWRPEVAGPLLGLGAAYAVGWWRLSRRGRTRLAWWRATAAAGALLGLALALLSPLDGVAHAVFAGHMLQHLLLIAVAAPALLLADPFPALLWALPGPLRARVGRLLRPGAPLRQVWARLSAMPVAWLAHALVVWLWHVPAAYDAAVADRLLHDLEHLTLFASAVLFWWPPIHPAPRVRSPAAPGLCIGYLVLAAFQGALLGLLLALSPETWYASYRETSGGWGLTPREDQALGGVLMWGLGGAVDMLAVLVVLQRYLGSEDRRAGRRAGASPDTIAHPGRHR